MSPDDECGGLAMDSGGVGGDSGMEGEGWGGCEGCMDGEGSLVERGGEDGVGLRFDGRLAIHLGTGLGVCGGVGGCRSSRLRTHCRHKGGSMRHVPLLFPVQGGGLTGA